MGLGRVGMMIEKAFLLLVVVSPVWTYKNSIKME